MNRDQKIDTTSQSGQASSAPRSTSRRRLLQAGVSASPVVLSFVSQPVRAISGQKTCRSASSFASFSPTNVATSHNPTATCTGNGPVTWKSVDVNFMAPVVQAAALKDFAVGTSYTVVDPAFPTVNITNPKVWQVLKYGNVNGTEREKLAMNVAASYLNVAGGSTPPEVMDAAKLANIWALCQASGGLYPVTSSGPNWDAAAANVWLTSTFVLS